MSAKPISAINRYRADLRELHFVLFEQHKLQEILGQAPFDAWSEAEVKSSINEINRFATTVSGPLNTTGDAQGCRIEDGGVKTPDGFKDAWRKLYEAGWKSIALDPEHGGTGGPFTMHTVVEEFLAGSNTSFSMYPGLTYGAGELVATFGTADQQHRYCEKMFDGSYAGTMCLTEPQAGSDVGACRTKAVKNADGTYSITGSKLFISGGDHDLSENIIHAVLARVEGAPAGTKGLTLFIVPKYRINADGTNGGSNDVTLGTIEHKMGIVGSSTCVLNFGENGGCVGEPLGGDGKLHNGMSQMFRMMNGARISVGVQSVAVASSAYLNALDYARERKQGSHIKSWKDPSAPRVPILQHPDVRRMLLDMKARVEGIRSLIFKLTTHGDRAKALAGKDDAAVAYHQGQVDLLVPLVKAYGSDQAFRICETAIQTMGGVGFTRDYPVEQYCRDSKIFSIYEGTNHIQAMDLVGRKLPQGGGANMQRFLGDIGKFVAANKEHANAAIASSVKQLEKATEALTGATMKFMGWAGAGDLEMVALNANHYLEAMSEVAVGWMLLDAAVIAAAAKKDLAESNPDHAFYTGKELAAVYFARNVLPGVEAKARRMNTEDRTPTEMTDAMFATI